MKHVIQVQFLIFSSSTYRFHSTRKETIIRLKTNNQTTSLYLKLPQVQLAQCKQPRMLFSGDSSSANWIHQPTRLQRLATGCVQPSFSICRQSYTPILPSVSGRRSESKFAQGALSPYPVQLLSQALPPTGSPASLEGDKKLFRQHWLGWV